MTDPAQHERLVAEALADLVDRQNRGESAGMEEFYRMHPELADKLRDAMDTLAGIDEAVDPEHPLLPERLSGHRLLG